MSEETHGALALVARSRCMAELPVRYELLSIFVAVAEATSFSKAARKLRISKATVSRAIASLEETLGAELIHRTSHAVALSTAGTALYERTAPLLRGLAEAIGRLPERGEQPSGLLRMTVPHDFGQAVMPDVLAQFALRYPDVSFDIHVTNEPVDLVARGFDLAIRVSGGALQDSTLTVRRLGSAGIGYYASPSYLARRGRPRALLADDHTWIAHARLVDAAKAKAQRARFVCDSFQLIRALIVDGVGVGPLPNFFAAPYVLEGRVEPVALPGRSLHGQLVLLYPSSGQVPRKVTAFRDFLLEWLAKSPMG